MIKSEEQKTIETINSVNKNQLFNECKFEKKGIKPVILKIKIRLILIIFTVAFSGCDARLLATFRGSGLCSYGCHIYLGSTS